MRLREICDQVRPRTRRVDNDGSVELDTTRTHSNRGALFQDHLFDRTVGQVLNPVSLTHLDVRCNELGWLNVTVGRAVTGVMRSSVFM